MRGSWSTACITAGKNRLSIILLHTVRENTGTNSYNYTVLCGMPLQAELEVQGSELPFRQSK